MSVQMYSRILRRVQDRKEEGWIQNRARCIVIYTVIVTLKIPQGEYSKIESLDRLLKPVVKYVI
jgi:hypothetical protein